jgi:hypothetical protein
MEALLFLVLIILIFVAYKLSNIEKTLHQPNGSSVNQLSTSLNPLFSEKEIEEQKILNKKWQSRVESTFEVLKEIEEKEIKEYKAGEQQIEFAPSQTLMSTILSYSVALTGRNTTYDNIERMVEANIAIFNGLSIKEASENYYSKCDGIPWDNLYLDADAWKDKKAINQCFENDLLLRKKYWQRTLEESK